MPDTIAKSVDAYATLSEQLVTKLLQALWLLWQPLDASTWWDDNLVAGNAARSATLVTSALHQVRVNQRSFSTAVFKQLDASMPLPSLMDEYARSNVTPFEVYQRPAKEYRFLTSQGLAFDETYMRAKTRLEGLARSDALRARMDEAQRLDAANPKVIGTRRIVHPELSRTGTCGLCLVASTQFYKKTELQPIHPPSCHCTTLSVTKDSDPGLKLSKDDLKAIYAAAGSSRAEDLANTRITVDEHGELGPLLVRDGQHFRTAAEAGRPAYVKQTPETIRAARVKERDQLTQALAKAQDDYSHMTPGTDSALPTFRAIKNMKERLASIDRFLRTL